MSAQTTITKLRQENAVMAALLKRASGEKLDAGDREVIAEVAKGRALEQRLREKYDIAGAIEKALRPTAPRALPAQDGDVAKAASGDTLEGAIAKAFTGTKTSATVRKSGGDLITQEYEAQQTRKAAELAKAQARKPISNQRADMFGLPRNS